MDDSALDDPSIAALRTRVVVSEDSAMSARAPRLRPARVTVTLKDGRKATCARESHRGDFNDPFEPQELHAKFRELAGYVLDHQGVAYAESLCADIEQIDDMGAAVAGLGRHARGQ
jgi:2-methylcitrate dehydratase PrpD